ncbi:MAG: 3',5'-cyclic-nucleotide phosphodiesterase [Pseudomonadota bacterium]
MKVRILGCSGGIGGRHMRTTSMLVDNDILIDAGTGVGELSVAALALIDHVFITHSHLDHIAMLPFILDTVGDMRNKPLTMYATQATQEIIRAHIFNWAIWPDFSEIPNAENPYLRFETIRLCEPVLINGREITPLPARHTVPAVGYRLDSGKASLVFTGDTSVNDEFWKEVNKIANLRYLIIETAFCNNDRQLAIVSKHLCPDLLADELLKLQRTPEIFITHLKPGQIELIMREIEEKIGEYLPRMLQNNQVFGF